MRARGLFVLVKNRTRTQGVSRKGPGCSGAPERPNFRPAFPQHQRVSDSLGFRVLETAGQRVRPALALRPEDPARVLVFGLVPVARSAQHLNVAGLVASTVPQWPDVIHLHSPRGEGMPAATAACPACAVDRSSDCLPDAVTRPPAVATPAALTVGAPRNGRPGTGHARTFEHEHPQGCFAASTYFSGGGVTSDQAKRSPCGARHTKKCRSVDLSPFLYSP